MMTIKTRKLKKEEINRNKKKAFEEGIVEWTQYFRANPHHFIVSYLGLPLFVFQMINITTRLFVSMEFYYRTIR